MPVPVQVNEIAFFRYRNRLLAGVCLSATRAKLRFAVSLREVVNVPADNLLLATGSSADDPRQAKTWWDRAVEESAEIDLEELWDLVGAEDEAWQAKDLGDLYYSGEVTPREIAALVVHLEGCPFFVPEGAGYRPRSEAEIAEHRAAQEREQAREEERALFGRWMRRDEEVDVPQSLLGRWTDRLSDYVLNGEQSPHARWVSRMCEDGADPKRVFERLVAHGLWEADEHLDLIRREVPLAFPPAVARSADELRLEALLGDTRRTDLRDLQVLTIDDASTTDMDDAVSAVLREDGSWQVGVHITDVASLISPNSELDNEAAARGSSLYFPDRKIPMLPPAVSADLGSLLPGEPRLTLSLLFEVEDDGTVGSCEPVLSVVRSAGKVAYDEADAILADPGHRLHTPLSFLHHVAEVAWTERLQAGAISVDHPERQVRLRADGQVEVVLAPRNSPADLLVSELMVTANSALAEFCRAREMPVAYRVQKEPDLSDLEETDNDILHRFRVLRRTRPASMSLEPGAHGSLGVPAYCQASSPLRRYGDLCVQRQVVAALLGEPLAYDAEEMRAICFQAEERMREAVRLERRRERYWFLKYLAGLVGETFQAVVLEPRGRDMIVEVVDYAFQSPARVSPSAEPGDVVEVRLGRCDPWEDRIAFTQVG